MRKIPKIVLRPIGAGLEPDSLLKINPLPPTPTKAPKKAPPKNNSSSKVKIAAKVPATKASKDPGAAHGELQQMKTPSVTTIDILRRAETSSEAPVHTKKTLNNPGSKVVKSGIVQKDEKSTKDATEEKVTQPPRPASLAIEMMEPPTSTFQPLPNPGGRLKSEEEIIKDFLQFSKSQAQVVPTAPESNPYMLR